MTKENYQYKEGISQARDLDGYIRIDTTIPILMKILEMTESVEQRLAIVDKRIARLEEYIFGE